MMKRSLLERLRTNGAYYLLSALLLLLAVPLYQIFILNPLGFSTISNASDGRQVSFYLTWISIHSVPFLLYRVLLFFSFLLLISMPFSLYRIIVAQEIMAQQEREEKANDGEDDTSEKKASENKIEDENEATLPAYAWRGKGFLVIAVWIAMLGLAIYLLTTAVSTLYLIFAHPLHTTSLIRLLSVGSNTLGIGLLGVGILFFGAMITRTGRNLWPGIWVAFGYTALFIGALLGVSAVAVASAPGTGQSTITTLATLLFALWVLWLGWLLLRLQPET